MKMTKNIREFIEEQVSERLEAATTDRLQELEERAKKAREEWSAQLEAMKQNFDAKLAELAEQFGYQYIGYSGKPSLPDVSFHCVDGNCLPEVKEYEAYRRELRNKEAKAVKDIIVSMELGGTKKELMEMIAKLEF